MPERSGGGVYGYSGDRDACRKRLRARWLGQPAIAPPGPSRDGAAVEVTVLAVPGCPHAPLLEEHLARALAGRADVDVVRREITDEKEAARWGMCGSPTLLLDGRDPFAAPGARPALACRLYRDGDGRLAGAPGVSDIRRALERHECARDGG